MTQQEWLEDPECCTSERIQILLKAVRKHNGNYRKMEDETLLQQILDGGVLGTGISFQEFAWILEKKDYEGLGEEFSETIADLRPDFLTDFIQTPRVVDLARSETLVPADSPPRRLAPPDTTRRHTRAAPRRSACRIGSVPYTVGPHLPGLRGSRHCGPRPRPHPTCCDRRTACPVS